MFLVEVVLIFVVLYPVVTSMMWVSGGILFRFLEEPDRRTPEPTQWPGVTVLIPAYNEEAVIAISVKAALAADYEDLEVLVLDDGSTDATAAVAAETVGDDPRCRVIRDPVNRGKADRLNQGFRLAQNDLVVVTDADTQLHPAAVKELVARMLTSPQIAAVAGAPHVTNRVRFLSTMQIFEAAAIIGLIRRTQALTGRVGTVAGVLGLFRRDCVLAVGGYDPKMATEDIELTWKLLAAGWLTAYEPRALVGMQVPTSLRALWAQRKRWARGQGEVLRTHLGEVLRWRNHQMWLMGAEAVVSLLWVIALVVALAIAGFSLALDLRSVPGLGLSWGVAIAVVATLQVTAALLIEAPYDPRNWRAFLVEPLYPAFFWLISAAATLRSETIGLIRGPRSSRVVWDLPREDMKEGR